MAGSMRLTEVKVENFCFPPSVKPPASHGSFFLAGAGVRGMELGGKFVKFTAIGVYLEDSAITELGGKWKGKTADELADSIEFFRDIVTGPFEKFTQVSMILPLTGEMYSEKVTENCVKFWKTIGIYTDEEAKAVEKFIEVFKTENFPPGHSIMFTQSPTGSLTVAFSKHELIPQTGKDVIENKNMAEAVLESIIGKHGVSPAAKQSIAARVSALINDQKAEDSAGKDVIENKNMAESVLEPIIGKYGVSPEAKQSISARVSALLNDQKAEDSAGVVNGKAAQ